MTSRKRSKASKKGWLTRKKNQFKKAGFSAYAAEVYSTHESDNVDALLQTREIALGGGPKNFKKRYKLSPPGTRPVNSANRNHADNWKGNLEGLKLMIEAEEREWLWYVKIATDVLGFTPQEARTIWFSPKARKSTIG